MAKRIRDYQIDNFKVQSSKKKVRKFKDSETKQKRIKNDRKIYQEDFSEDF